MGWWWRAYVRSAIVVWLVLSLLVLVLCSIKRIIRDRDEVQDVADSWDSLTDTNLPPETRARRLELLELVYPLVWVAGR